MTMKKKILTTLSVVLILGLAALGILAYLQDDDSDVNVMTLGNVSIDQIEQERDADGKLQNFTQDKPAFPAVGPIAWADEGVDVNGTEYKVFTEDLKNVVDKIVTVKNKGKSDAYVRTVVAIEAPDYDPNDLIHINYNSTGVNISAPVTTTINGSDYVIFTFTYVDALAADKSSAPSLMQVFLDAEATNDDCAAFGENWEMLVASQAVQKDGFADAATALDTAFGPITKTNHPWVDTDFVRNAEELNAALGKDVKIVLVDDITLDEAVTEDKPVSIDLNGHTLTTVGLDLTNGGIIEDGTVASAGNTNLTPHLKISGGTVIMEDVTVDVNHHLNANVYWSEATGMEVANATAILKNCNIKINNQTKAQWVYSYGISLNNAELTMNGGSITAACVAGTAANGPTNPNAISTMGDVTTTLKNVDVTATYYVTTVNGHATINTTDKTITSANIVDNRGGSHTLNYID